MSDSYVTSQAILKCSCGDRTAKLTVYPDRTVFLIGKPMANISDHISLYNISSFGKCHTVSYPATGAATAANKGKLTPMPCVPGTLSRWLNGKDDYIIKGRPALLKSSYCRCQWGGIITITGDGQNGEGVQWIRKEPKEELQKNVELMNSLPDNLSKHEKQKIAKHSLEIEKALNVKKGKPMTMDEADKQSANPNYGTNASYGINCATVSNAYVLRLQGFDITAKGNTSNTLNEWISYGDNSFKVWKNTDGTQVKPIYTKEWLEANSKEENPEMTPELYKKFLTQACDKEGVYLYTLDWKNGGGHATIIHAKKDKSGNIQIFNIEPQVYDENAGVELDVDELCSYLAPNPHSSRAIMRVDDKLFDINYLGLFNVNNMI